MILEISEKKSAGFSEYGFFLKKNIHRTFLDLLKCPFNNSKMKAKVRVIYTKQQLAMIVWIVSK